MADTFEMEIQGLDKLLSTFQGIFEDVANDPIIIQAMTLIGKNIEGKAKDFLQEKIYNTPESPTYKRTGMLKARTTSDLPEQDTNGNPKVKIRSRQFYAPYIEMGTIKMKARPFMLPAAQMEAENSSKIFVEALNKFLKSKVTT